MENYETVGNDLPTAITWNVGDNVLTATRYDPYGFWRFSFKRGQIPNCLQGDFTGELKVIGAVESYLALRRDK